MSESVLAEGTWAEDGDSDIDMKPLPPSPVVEPQKVSVIVYVAMLC